MDRGIGAAFEREFGGRNEMGMSRNNFGDSFDRGMGQLTMTLVSTVRNSKFFEVHTL